jgi:uncharacterized protein (TIGR02118 family)
MLPPRYSAGTTQPVTKPQEDTMIIVSVMYPATAGAKFDMDYYLKTHMPLVGARWNARGLRDAKVLRGVAAPGGGAAAYSVIALLTFDATADFEQAVARDGAEIMGDIANFSSVQPLIQISEVVG